MVGGRSVHGRSESTEGLPALVGKLPIMRQSTSDITGLISPRIAQIGLTMGADDIDGTVVHEKIYHEAGSDTPQELQIQEIRHLITEAGREPRERDTLYRRVIRDTATWHVEGEPWRVP